MNLKDLRYGVITAAMLAVGAAVIGAQEPRATRDPRVGLKAGVRDAAQAIRNLELVASLPRPAGFFDPAQPLGPPTPAEPQPGQRQQQTAPQRRPEFNPATANRLDFSNSDMA